MCVLDSERLGWFPANARLGDVVCVLNEAKVPHLLRPREDGFYELLGERYVDGLMKGEVLGIGSIIGRVANKVTKIMEKGEKIAG